jgi:hypothetical protein
MIGVTFRRLSMSVELQVHVIFRTVALALSPGPLTRILYQLFESFYLG